MMEQSQNEKLSVIMTVYNGRDYLAEAIESVLASEYSNLELIIVDDGSTDTSEEIYSSYANSDYRIRTFKKKNGGIADARNYGIRVASGKYIAFVDQDDKVSPDMYKNCIETMIQDKSDMCVTNYYKWTPNSHEENQFVHENSSSNDIDGICADLVGVNDINKQYNHPSGRVTHCIWNCVYDFSVIKNAGIVFYRYVDYEDDYIFNINFVHNSRKISFNTSYGYNWRQWGKTESSHHKYIEDLYNKRLAFVGFLEDSVKNCSEDLELFKAVNLRKTIIWSFYNESMFKNRSTCRRLLKIIAYDNRSALKSKNVFVGAPIKDRFFVWLIKHKLYNLAYWINRYLLHCYYH